MKNFFIIFILHAFALTSCEGDFDYFTSDVPSHLPSPPKVDHTSISRQDGGPLGTGLAGAPPIPPPQNVPVNPFGPGIGGPGGGGLPDGFVPFGLNHIILIIVPMFKAKFQKLPKWLSSTIKISMPITVFFDQLTVPPGMFVPGVGGLPLPLGVPPPIGLGQPGIPISPPAPAVVPQNSGNVHTTNAQTNPGYMYPQPAYHGGNSYGPNPETQQDEEDEEEDGYDNSYTEEDRKRRRKRATFADSNSAKSRKRRAISFNETLHSAERAALFPKLETLLENGGFGGKSCLLRAICEVHEAPLNHYGLLGELFTMFFSVSKSAFAESHLPEYLRAEEVGKAGNCSQYFNHCENTIFSWEEVTPTKKKRKKVPAPVMFNVIDEVL